MAVVGDYAAQGVISTMIHNAFPDDLIVGEEDATDLRLDSGADLRRRIVELANEAIVGPLGVGDVTEWGIEETFKAGGQDVRMWTIDPIDGTKGFLRGEQYAVCLFLIVDAQVQVGVIGCPNLPFDADTKGSIFVAVRGQGAEQLNIEGSNPTPISMPTLAPSELYFLESVEAAHASHSTNDKISSILGITGPPIRMDSQAKYGCLARGDGGVYMRMPTGAGYKEKIWDHAPGAVLVEEACGVITDSRGRPLDFGLGRTLGENFGVIAASKVSHPKVLEAVQKAIAPEEKLKAGSNALQGCIKYEYLPQVTLSALNETGRAESTIPVLQQRSYTGKKPVITSALADARCIDLGMDRILEVLNTTLGTSYTLDDHDSILQSVFQSFIARSYDFGILYANVRPYWYDLTLIKHISELWMKDQERRQDCFTNNRISLDFPWRRVWDLCANRVVPYWVTRSSSPMPISHAWMAPDDRFQLWTPINCYEWPVPIPKDADLNLIRIEMLNQERLSPRDSVEYVWLDVLCLRQEGGEREDLRVEEWKVDVPTIGSLYSPPVWFVVYYLSGLGRPLSLKPGDLENEQNWFNRAWTLQEIAGGLIIGGGTDVNLITDNDIKAKLIEKLQSVQRIREADVFHLLWQMQIRQSTKPLDKVAGLAYLLCGFESSGSIPIYDETQSQEDAVTIFPFSLSYLNLISILSHLIMDISGSTGPTGPVSTPISNDFRYCATARDDRSPSSLFSLFHT
ncbi:uncharacterized protein ARMOST_14050 [Armillaria ostoyae]|uniref:3'(2'),5'-bisphosphate nucleotidase n=1 Tax=Armillaria ostoyae TaxID=47428 RepID=A0A284RPI1_ARMOS|nr:uncharacterized protein ARMOST_14050 [Armillaria ostoyae]